MTSSIVAAFLYGLFTLLGGIMGYIKSHSKISLISGCFSGILLLSGALAALRGNAWGLTMAMIVTALLVIVFIVRWFKTRKVMPAGLMVGLGGIALVVMVMGR
ncbi:TMEM14 family protein [Acaryochloris sp. IP29b_bin.148]|uniref:TMEM14 family protein n=1 Tax=Acaryochloris sp. IP29b_bin.148 TaxID=2969218 RepID=UPI002612E0C2|nr:TMEM14 family protein [Acaryochloris sp. IP29b_bin.148]